MNFHLTLVFFVGFYKVEEILCNPKRNALKKAFSDITDSLMQKNRFVSVIMSDFSDNNIKSAITAATAGIPHVNFEKRFVNEMSPYELNSSAIVSLDSVASMKVFNNRTNLFDFFSMPQQLIIFCQDGTFKKIETIPAFSYGRKIIHHEYFLIEEENSLRLLTFLWFTPKKCKQA